MIYTIAIVDEPMTFKQVLKEIGKRHGRHPKLSDITIKLEEGGYGACATIEYEIEDEEQEW